MSKEERSVDKISKEENHILELIVKTKDRLLPNDPTNLDAINTYFSYINLPDLDENELENDLTDPPLFTPLSHPLDNYLQVLSF